MARYKVMRLEGNNHAQARQQMTPEEIKLLSSWENDCYLEPRIIRPESPDLNKKVTIELDGNGSRDDALSETAKKLGLNLVSDSYSMYRKVYCKMSIEEGTVRQVLDALTHEITPMIDYNWDKPSSVIEMSDRNWYYRRQFEIPDAWIEDWRESVEQTGTLDLEQLAEMAALTEEQFWVNVAGDEVLQNSRLTQQIRRSGEYLKVYNTLTHSQRSALHSSRGLSLASLNSTQQQAVFKIISGLDVPEDLPDLRSAGLDARATASRVQQGRKYIYTFRGTINGLPLPGEYVLSTPEYKSAGPSDIQKP